METKDILSEQNDLQGNLGSSLVARWLRIQRCGHCCDAGHSCVTGSTPGPGTSTCCRCGEKKNRRQLKILSHLYKKLLNPPTKQCLGVCV